MTLQPIPFTLPAHIGVAQLEDFSRLSAWVEKIGQGSGKSGSRFQHRCAQFIRFAEEGLGISQMIEDRRDIHVALHLWITNDDWRLAIPLDRKAFVAIFGVIQALRPSHVYDLIQIYLLYFNELPDLNALSALLQRSFRDIPEKRLLTDMKKLRSYESLIFSEGAPKNVAAHIAEADQRFDEGLNKIGVSQTKGGQFLQECKKAYFVETVKRLRPGDLHAVFKELVKSEIKESPYNSRLNVGQAVCTEMIEKCKQRPKGMPKSWINLVLRIIGDPRRPQRSRSYQLWWQSMKRDHEAFMRRWLAGFDLHLFLKILDDSSTSETLARMYPARRAFLEGLLDHYGVEDARLFLGVEAANFIRRQYGRDALLAHGLLSDRNKTVIYIRVNGHDFFEGTHNYAARLGVGLPLNHPILTRNRNKFTMSEISTDLDYEMKGSTNKTGKYFYVRHHPPLTWQSKLIDGFGQLGLRIKPQDVLTGADYIKYRRKFGI